MGQPRMVGPLLAAICVAAAPPVRAAVWKRTNADGTVEFTNRPPRSATWKPVREVPRHRAARAPRAGLLSSGLPSKGSTVWSRENDDGTVEFTNIPPVGTRWKVLFRTGPGKASAERGPTDIVPPRDSSPGRLGRYDDHIRDQHAIYGVPQALMRAVIKTESDFDPQVVSSAGAAGLTQLLPTTARLMGVTDIWDPRQNIMGGARYLQTLARRFCRTAVDRPTGVEGASFVCSDDELVKVIAGYHAGPGAVEKYGGMPPYETTRAYVTTVLARFDLYREKDALADAGRAQFR